MPLETAPHDPVNHPKHYTSHPSGVECIDITRHMSFNLGNAVKYLWRADEKGAPIQDLEKAVWYINDEIKRRRSHCESICIRCSKKRPEGFKAGSLWMCGECSGNNNQAKESETSEPKKYRCPKCDVLVDIFAITTHSHRNGVLCHPDAPYRVHRHCGAEVTVQV